MRTKVRVGKSSYRKWFVRQKVQMGKSSCGKMFERKRFVFEKVRKVKDSYGIKQRRQKFIFQPISIARILTRLRSRAHANLAVNYSYEVPHPLFTPPRQSLGGGGTQEHLAEILRYVELRNNDQNDSLGCPQ